MIMYAGNKMAAIIKI